MTRIKGHPTRQETQMDKAEASDDSIDARLMRILVVMSGCLLVLLGIGALTCGIVWTEVTSFSFYTILLSCFGGANLSVTGLLVILAMGIRRECLIIATQVETAFNMLFAAVFIVVGLTQLHRFFDEDMYDRFLFLFAVTFIVIGAVSMWLLLVTAIWICKRPYRRRREPKAIVMHVGSSTLSAELGPSDDNTNTPVYPTKESSYLINITNGPPTYSSLFHIT